MLLEPERCYRALRTRDARFDGRFFVGVASTGIYCRPVCTARAPSRDHCRFFPTAAAAEGAGFRPCLRCRPELAPGNSSIDASRRLAVRAASLIEDGVLVDGHGLERVAARLGVTDRHLRRVFHEEFGVSLVEFAQTQRLLLAKRLLTDTRLPVVDVAMASGFASLRRFNALFKSRYRLVPTELRKRAVPAAQRAGFRFRLRVALPFDYAALLGFLSRRTIDGVDVVDDDVYRRTVRVEHRGQEHVGWIDVAYAKRLQSIELHVSPSLAKVLPAVVARVKRLFDLGCAIRDVESVLGPLAASAPGLRVPGAFDGFELAVRAILGQQVTVAAARTLAGRVARTFGSPLDTGVVGLECTFPAAARIADASVDRLAALGVIGTRARAIIDVARLVASGQLVLEPAADVEAAMKTLGAIPGVGEWTTQYVAMRALAWPDAFPAGDYGVMKALGETKVARVRQMAEQWRPWRAYAVMHLWRSIASMKADPVAAALPPHDAHHASRRPGPGRELHLDGGRACGGSGQPAATPARSRSEEPGPPRRHPRSSLDLREFRSKS